MAKIEHNLEEALKRISDIVKSLESNEISLEESLKLFEEGVNLTKNCHQKLTEAEKKIEILTQSNETKYETKIYEP